MLTAKVSLILALATLAIAFPSGSAVTRIPVRPRDSFVGSDGMVSTDKVLADVERTARKYARHNEHLSKRGAGVPATQEGYPGKINSAAGREPASVPIHFVHDGLVDTGPISVGTPAQNFTAVTFDTGSTLLWVASSSCTDSSCTTFQDKFEPAASSTAINLTAPFTETFGDFSSVNGTFFSDFVSVGGIIVSNYSFGVIDEDNTATEQGGLMGFAFGTPDLPTWFEAAVSQGAVEQGVFAIKMATNGTTGLSELTLGGVDHSQFKGDIEYHPVNSSTHFWVMPGGNVLLNSKPVKSDLVTIMDSGTSFILGPPADIEAIWAQVPGSSLFTNGSTTGAFWSYPCDEPPQFAFSWGGKDWELTPENLNMGELNVTHCLGSLGAVEVVEELAGKPAFANFTSPDIWIVGDPFLRSIYSVWSLDDVAIGFAELRDATC